MGRACKIKTCQFYFICISVLRIVTHALLHRGTPDDDLCPDNNLVVV